jgi:tagatose 1,6-diphosphate aldolase GatY/KbaY
VVFVGNVYGLEDIPRIDILLLQEIAKVCSCPLVIHGGSGIDEDIIRSFVKYNVVKVNIASDLRKAFITTVGQAWTQNNNEANLAKVMSGAKAAVESDVYSKILMMNRAS